MVSLSSLNLIGQTVFKLEYRNKKCGRADRQTDVRHINLIGGLVACNPPNEISLMLHMLYFLSYVKHFIETLYVIINQLQYKNQDVHSYGSRINHVSLNFETFRNSIVVINKKYRNIKSVTYNVLNMLKQVFYKLHNIWHSIQQSISNTFLCKYALVF